MDENVLTKLNDVYEGYLTHNLRFERVTKDTAENLLAFIYTAPYVIEGNEAVLEHMKKLVVNIQELAEVGEDICADITHINKIVMGVVRNK